MKVVITELSPQELPKDAPFLDLSSPTTQSNIDERFRYIKEKLIKGPGPRFGIVDGKVVTFKVPNK